MTSSGGNLLDTGLYGCTFTSPLRCKPNTIDSLSDDIKLSDSISKVIDITDAELEFIISKIIHKIPLYRNYFAVSESICELHSKQTDKNIKRCIHDKTSYSDMRILNMPYAGVTLSTKSFDLSRFNFMEFIIHFISAGALLNLFGIVHRDLHNDNILVDEHNIPRIIDFNLSIFIRNQNLDINDIQHKYEYDISQEPPDSTLVNAISRGNQPNKVLNDVIFKKSIIKKINSLLGISKESMFQDLQQFYYKSKSVKSGDLLKWFHTYYRVIDSWAVGINIVLLIHKLLLWSKFRPTYNKYKTKLIPLLKKLCSVNPLDRVDCVQALYYLDPNHFIIRKYASQWLSIVGNGNIH
jgi:serine/threonine protein kinase